MNPSPTSVPGGPLGRYLLHPGPKTSVILHHALHVLAAVGRVAAPVLVAAVALVLVGRLVLVLGRRQRSHSGAHLVVVAPGPEVEASGGEALWSGLHGVLRRGRWASVVSGRPRVCFEIARSAGRFRFALWVPPQVSPSRVAGVVEAAWPGALAEVEPASAPVPVAEGVAAGELHLARPEWFALRVEHPVDPYRLLLGALAGLRSGDAGVVQVLARPARSSRYRRCRQAAVALRTGRRRSKLVRFVDFWMTKGVAKTANLSADPTRASDVRAITEKASALCFEATVRYGVVGATGGRAERQHLRADGHGIVGAFALYDARNRLARRRLAHPYRSLCARRLGRGDLYSVGELAALAHLPTDRAVAGLSHAGAHAVAPPPEVGTGGKVLGRAEVGERRPVGLAVADARQHLHILGATGSGKSTLLTNLVLQDVMAKRGAVVIDPKGDLIDDIIDRLPVGAAGRVVVLDADDDTAPPAMNVLDAAQPHLAVDHLVGIFHRLFEAYWGPRTDDVLRVAALTALRQPGATLADIPRLLTEPVFRAALIRGLDDPTLKGFWDTYEKMSPAAQSQMVGPVMNKLRVVLTRPFVAAVLGSATSSFDIGTDVLDGGLLLARLPKGTLGEDSCRLLGSFVVAKVWQAVTARARTGQAARADATLYLDEAQNFLTLPGSIGDMLAEARGYRLSVVAAHQHLGQLPRELRDALSANARNKAFFNCSPEDAKVLERHVAPELSDHDLSHLGAHQVAARLIVDWEESPAFTLRTEPAPDPQRHGEEIRARSRQRFGRSRAQRHDEALRRQLAGRRGTQRRDTAPRDSAPRSPASRNGGRRGTEHRGDVEVERRSAGTSVGSSPGRSPGTLELPGSPWSKRHHNGALTPADDDSDSWCDL
jgi:hypothetical protein